MSMYQGPRDVIVPPGSLIEIRADAGFTAYAVNEKNEEEKYLLGPFNSAMRMIRVFIPDVQDVLLRVKTSKATFWSLEHSEVKFKETPDPTKHELLISGDVEPNINDMIKMYIKQETNKHFNEEMETIEESLDLDLPEEHEPLSGYEVTDMEPEYAPLPDDQGTTKPAETSDADDDKSAKNDDSGTETGSEQTVQSPDAGDKTATG